MDTATLVNEKIDDGKAFVDKIKAGGFSVVAAFWVLPTEAERWFLYIASRQVDTDGLARAYQAAYDELSKSQVQSISISDLKLVGSQNPIALDAMKYRSRIFGTRFGGRKLGSMIIEAAYIYPQ